MEYEESYLGVVLPPGDNLVTIIALVKLGLAAGSIRNAMQHVYVLTRLISLQWVTCRFALNFRYIGQPNAGTYPEKADYAAKRDGAGGLADAQNDEILVMAVFERLLVEMLFDWFETIQLFVRPGYHSRSPTRS